jgi:exodeoxyribonuclease VII small subunit
VVFCPLTASSSLPGGGSPAKSPLFMAEPTKEHTFETAMRRLETLVRDMESDDLPLEDLLTAYEEGIGLVKVCQTQLAKAQQRLEIIQANAAGDLSLKEFSPGTAKPDAPQSRSSAKDVSLF